MAESSKDKIVIDYTSRDFDAIRSMLVGIAKGKMPDWQTVGQASDFGTLLLELYAYMGDVSNYYIDRVGSEAFLGTAQRRQSVYYMADMLGYKPVGQRAATVIISFTASPNYFENNLELVIPAGTALTDNSSDQTFATYFETDTDLRLTSSNLTGSVSATEGRTITDELLQVSKGSPNATFVLEKKGVVYNSVILRTVEGGVNVPWTEIDSVANARPNQSAFSTYLDDQNFTYVVMGDRSAGRVPPIGSDIYVSYRYGTGASANGVGSGAITNIVSNASWVSSVSASNNAPPQGGSDPESLESMRFSIPRASRVRSRAVNLDDHVILSLQVPGVAKATAYGSVYSSVNIRIAPVGGFLASETGAGVENSDLASLRLAVKQYLSDKILIGSKIFVERPEWHDVQLELNLNVLDGYEQSSVESDVINAVYDLFSFESLDFGQKITKGDVYRAVTKISGVDFVEIVKMRPTNPSSSENPKATVQNIFPPPKKIAQLQRSRSTTNNGEIIGLTVNSTGGLGAS